jgi:RNA polymerase sigma factor (sigma-70 family)
MDAHGHKQREMASTDDQLWQRLHAGDHDAFALLFERHADLIYNYCFRRLGDRVAAEDMLSIVFLEAWRRRGKALPSGKVLPWLYGIATNVVHNERRSRRRYAAALSRLPVETVEPDLAERADERLGSELQMRGALALLTRLPKREQDVFVLCSWMELSYEDAAAALGIPVGTVRSRLSRAHARLRELDSPSGHKQGEDVIDPEARER